MGNVTTLAYDALGRKTAMTDPDLGTWQYQYDAVGNLTSQSDAKGQTIGFGYDALDRLIAESGGATASYGYDVGTNGKGQRTSATNPAATVTYAYDTAWRPWPVRLFGNDLGRTRVVLANRHGTRGNYAPLSAISGRCPTPTVGHRLLALAIA